MRVAVAAASLLLAALGALAGKHDIYQGYSVLEVQARNEAEALFLHALEEPLGLDAWQHAQPPAAPAQLMVAPAHRANLEAALRRRGLDYSVHVPDVQKMLEQQDLELELWRARRRSTGSRNEPFNDFPRHDEINEYLDYLVATYPDEVTVASAGTSYEGRDIRYVRVSSSNFTDASKPVYFLDALIHAREWVTAPVALHVLHRLLEARAAGEEDLLADVDWLVLPVVNPDGYEFTHTNDRMWRRTRSFNPDVNTACLGVDGNRNFNVSFASIGVSSNPCDQTWPGTEPFSDPETRAVRDLLLEHLPRVQLYLNIHSWGNYVLYGFGSNTVLPGNAAALHHVGAALGAAIDAHKLPQAPFYRVGNSGLILYPSSGSAQDYAQSIGVPFSYTLELPGLGYGFQVPPQYIEQINRETWVGIAASARLARLYYAARRADAAAGLYL